MMQRHTRRGIDRSAEPADAHRLAFQLLRSLNAWNRHQARHQTLRGDCQRHDIRAADGRARRRAAGDGEEFDLAGDHRRHSLRAAGKRHEIDVEAIFLVVPGILRRPVRRHVAGERSIAGAQPAAILRRDRRRITDHANRDYRHEKQNSKKQILHRHSSTIHDPPLPGSRRSASLSESTAE